MQLVGGTPSVDPYGWTAEAGFDDALDAMGWASSLIKSTSAEEALDRLQSSLIDGPYGPVESKSCSGPTKGSAGPLTSLK
jgi:hypothetical protein